MAPVLLLLLACADPPPCKADCLRVAVTLHVEGWSDLSPGAYTEHLHAVNRVLDAVEAHGGRATLDLSDSFLVGMKVHPGVDPIYTWADSGHGIGLHAETWPSTTREQEVEMRNVWADANALGLEPVHISGACGAGNWVRAVGAAGLKAATGLTGWCMRSYAEEDAPNEYAQWLDCRDPSLCHSPVPSAADDVVHPWRAESGRNWLTPADEGLVLVAGGGALPCAAEYAAGESGTRCTYDEADNEEFLAHLDGCSAAANGGVNTCGFTWSVGDEPDDVLFDALLDEIQARVNGGGYGWATIPEIVEDVP